MKRLTYVKCSHTWDRGAYPTKYTSRHTFQEVVARLAAYEDTGLTPEEIISLKDGICMGCSVPSVSDEFRHVQDLLEAEKAGRLTVLPCKKGDTLWSFYDYPIKGISKIEVTAVSTLDGITVINTDNYGVISEKDVGNAVFLTREEAEMALKKRPVVNDGKD